MKLKAAIFSMCFLWALSSAAQDNQDPPQQPDPSSDEKAEHQHEDSEAHQLKFFDTVDVSQRGDDLLGIAGSSNEGTTGREDLEIRPKLRAGELVETVPGAIATDTRAAARPISIFCAASTSTTGPISRSAPAACR